MSNYNHIDPYVYGGTDIIKNSLNIRDDSKIENLRRFERAVTLDKIFELQKNFSHHEFSSGYFCNLHKEIFKEVYPEMAGQIRSISLTKQEIVLGGASVTYSPPQVIKAELEDVMRRFAGTNFNGLKTPTDINNFSTHIAELWKVHPFREGNTRVMLLFCEQLSRKQNFELDAQALSRIPSETRDALVMAAEQKDNTLLNQLIANARQVAQLKNSPIGRLNADAVEVLQLLGNPPVIPAEPGESLKGKVLVTSYDHVFVRTAHGDVRSIEKQHFKATPQNNTSISVELPKSVEPAQMPKTKSRLKP